MRPRSTRARPWGSTAIVLVVVLAAILTFTLGNVNARTPSELGRTSLPPTLQAPRPAGGHDAPLEPLSGCPISSLAPTLHDPGVRPRQGGAGGLVAHNIDPSAVPNSGFEFNLTAYAMPSGSGSFLLTEQEQIGTGGLIMGLYANSSIVPAPIPIWAQFDNLTDHFISCGYETQAPVVGQSLSFQALHLTGRTWEVLFDGKIIPGSTVFPPSNNITMNQTGPMLATSLSIVSLSTWTGSAAPWVPAIANLTSTMKVLLPTGWYLPHPVIATWNGSGPPAWGEAGTLQRPSLPPGELQIGSQVAPVANWTDLWTTAAPTPLAVTVNVTATTVTGGGTTPLTVRATAGGLPISGLAVNVVSDGGGAFSPPLPWTTDLSGSAGGNFTAPLVSTPRPVTLAVSVTSSEYAGFANRTVTVTPTPLLLSVRLSTSEVGVGGQVNVTVGTYHDGTGVPGVNLSFLATVGGGLFVPAAPWVTQDGGNATGDYLAPPTPGGVELIFNVTTTGYSGGAVAWLNVTGSTGTGSGAQVTFGQEVDVGLGLLLVLVIVIFLASRRRSSVDLDDEEDRSAGTVSPSAEGTTAPAARPDVGASAPSTWTYPDDAPEKVSNVCVACGTTLPDDADRFCPNCGVPLGGHGG